MRYYVIAGASMALWGTCYPTFATLEADVVTSRGTITVELAYGEAPKAVANFIGLASGSRAWLDTSTGLVRTEPFYNGRLFDRVVAGASERRVGVGDAADDGANPGYTFPDEFHSSLKHAPYVIAMDNRGPNTNGASFYFTADQPIVGRDGRHTVFGSVPGEAGRAVIDEILQGGAGTTEILSINFRRTDMAAEAFDIGEVELPEITAVQGPLRVVPGVAADIGVERNGISLLTAHSSEDLFEWTPWVRDFRGLDDPQPPFFQRLDGAESFARFYRISLVNFPQALGVSSFAARTLVVESPGVGELVYRFDETGSAGTYENVVFPGEPPLFSGNFTVSETIPSRHEAYAFSVLIHAPGLGGAPYNLIRGGYESVNPTSVTGRQFITMMDAALGLVFEDNGTFRIDRP